MEEEPQEEQEGGGEVREKWWWIPLALLGAVVAIGGMTALFSGLPWQTKEEAASEEKHFDDRMTSLLASQNTTAAQLAVLTSQVIQLTTEQAKWEQRLEDDEKMETFKKMNRLQKEKSAAVIAQKLDRRDYDHQIKRMDNALRDARCRGGGCE